MAINKITVPDAHQVLRRLEYGYLSLTEADGTPYCTVVYYAVGSNGNIIAHTVDLHLVEKMRANPALCFMAHDFTDSSHWAVVRANGRYREATSEEYRAQLLAQLYKAHEKLTPEESKMSKGSHQAVVYEIVVTRLDGETEG